MLQAFDADAEQRKELRRQRDKERKAKLRRAANAKTRDEWLRDHSTSRQQPWKAFGWSRAKWYKNGKPEPERVTIRKRLSNGVIVLFGLRDVEQAVKDSQQIVTAAKDGMEPRRRGVWPPGRPKTPAEKCVTARFLSQTSIIKWNKPPTADWEALDAKLGQNIFDNPRDKCN